MEAIGNTHSTDGEHGRVHIVMKIDMYIYNGRPDVTQWHASSETDA